MLVLSLLPTAAIAAALLYRLYRLLRQLHTRRRRPTVWTAMASLWSAPHDAGVPVDQHEFARIVEGLAHTAPERGYGRSTGERGGPT